MESTKVLLFLKTQFVLVFYYKTIKTNITGYYILKIVPHILSSRRYFYPIKGPLNIADGHLRFQKHFRTVPFNMHSKMNYLNRIAVLFQFIDCKKILTTSEWLTVHST